MTSNQGKKPIMKTEKQIENKIKALEGLLTNPDLEDEVIMGIKQRTQIRKKIQILEWILGIEK